MSTIIYVVIGILIAAAFFYLRLYLRYRGERVVTCPETKQPVGVEVDAAHAAVRLLGSGSEIRLSKCTRWPEKKDCGRECLGQIHQAPEDCLVRNIVSSWYAGKSCVYCGRDLRNIEWLEHKPALRAPDGRMLEWSAARPETIYDVMRTHLPVCWDCHMVEKFRAEHPELVVERPSQS
jgi:hypothetical protein